MAKYVLAAGDPAKIALTVVKKCGKLEQISYAKLRGLVNGTAKHFCESGVQNGNRVMLRIGNTSEFPITFLALSWIGAVPIITSSALTIPEVEELIQISQPEFMIADDHTLVPQCNVPCIRSKIIFDKAPPIPAVMEDPNRAGFVMFTSGTSAKPKAVVHAHRAVWSRRMMWADWYDLKVDDRVFHSGAFNWSYTLGTGLLDPWAIGATAVIAPDIPVKDIPNLLEKCRITIFASSPAMFRKISKSDVGLKLSDFRHSLSAGDVLPEKVRSKWEEITQRPIFEAFGMTECSTFLSQSPHDPTLSPQRGRRISIRTGNAAVRNDNMGSIAVHTNDPGLMLGYLERDCVSLPQQNGWFITSDTGKMHDGHQIEFLGRNSDLLNAGGFRVSALEVEETLSKAIEAEVAVASIVVKKNVEVIMAFVTSTDEQEIETLEQFAKSNLARFKQPRAYIPVGTLPRTANGKLVRNKFQKIWEQYHGQT